MLWSQQPAGLVTKHLATLLAEDSGPLVALALGLRNLDVTVGGDDKKDAAVPGLPEASRCPRVACTQSATASVGF